MKGKKRQKAALEVYDPEKHPEWVYTGDENKIFQDKKYGHWILRQFRLPNGNTAIFAKSPNGAQ
ncbi:MAG TPA: hypothetical protein VMV84_03860 [Dehalococcoidales bacterium]|nr:hypothetical protein [Dehalococcoidales bacterium]